MTRRGAWTRRAAAVFSCTAITAVAGCSAGSATSAGPDTPTSATAAASQAHATATARPTASIDAAVAAAPLTGVAVPAAAAQRPAVAVAVAGASPVGLGSADLVFEEITSPVRYIAVFQSDETSKVGPVTSTRPTDGQALSVLHPLIGYDGGTAGFISTLDATKVIDAGYASHAPLYSPGSGGLTVSTAALAAASRSDGPPPSLFTYRLPGDPLASTRETHPTSVRVNIPGQQEQRWTFDARADRWVQAAGGPRVSVANLVIQIVPFKTVYLSHRYGLTTQSARVIGRGQATVFSGKAPGGGGGSAASATWVKPSLAAVTNYIDSAGGLLAFAPGPTWIVLAPAGTRISPAGG